MIMGIAASNTLIQEMVLGRLRGRVMAVYSMRFRGMTPIGSLLACVLAEPVGAPEPSLLVEPSVSRVDSRPGPRLSVLQGTVRRLIAAQQTAIPAVQSETGPSGTDRPDPAAVAALECDGAAGILAQAG